MVSGRGGYTPSTRKPYLPLMGSAIHPSIVSRKFLQGPNASRPIPWKPAAIPGHGGTGGRCSAAMQQGHVDGAADRNRHRRLVIASRAVLLLLLPCNCACVVHNAMGKSPHGTMCKLPNTRNGFFLGILDMRSAGWPCPTHPQLDCTRSTSSRSVDPASRLSQRDMRWEASCWRAVACCDVCESGHHDVAGVDMDCAPNPLGIFIYSKINAPAQQHFVNSLNITLHWFCTCSGKNN